MIVTRNIGRLGNNMFQISCAIGYARKYGHRWAADESSGHGEPFSAIHKVFPNLPKSRYGGGTRFHEHNNEFCKLHNQHKDQCHFNYHPIPNMGPNVSLSGFYQSWKYFEGAEKEIREVFKLPIYLSMIEYVSIHIRRGDYVIHSGSFPPIGTDYIRKGMEHFPQDQKYVVFSDDLLWCKENLKHDFERQFIFAEETDEAISLGLMSSCYGHIIANSSFSWWAAWLDNNENKKVICPSAETWFGSDNGVKQPVVDLLPPEWIQIHTR